MSQYPMTWHTHTFTHTHTYIYIYIWSILKYIPTQLMYSTKKKGSPTVSQSKAQAQGDAIE